jgi:hypothetical protein
MLSATTIDDIGPRNQTDDVYHSSDQRKRNSSPSMPSDKTPSKRSKTASSSGGKPSRSSSFVAMEDVALCKTYVNVTLNPIDGVGQKSSAFWYHIHRKYCALSKEGKRATRKEKNYTSWQ